MMAVCAVQRSRDAGCAGARVSTVHHKGVHAGDRLVWLWDGPSNSHAGAGILSLCFPPLAGNAWRLCVLLQVMCIIVGYFFAPEQLKAGALWVDSLTDGMSSWLLEAECRDYLVVSLCVEQIVKRGIWGHTVRTVETIAVVKCASDTEIGRLLAYWLMSNIYG